MITLTRKKKDSGAGAIADKRISIREFLLVKEVQELEQNLPSTCKISFQDANVLSDFNLSIAPNEGFWQGGRFKFSVHVPEEYNMAVSYSIDYMANRQNIMVHASTSKTESAGVCLC